MFAKTYLKHMLIIHGDLPPAAVTMIHITDNQPMKKTST